MKTIKLTLALLTLGTTLCGCVAVPIDQGYYAEPPVYYEPAPVYYGPPAYYYGPSIGIGIYGRGVYRDGHRHWHR